MMKKVLIAIGIGFSICLWSCGDPSQPAGEETARQHEADNAGQNEEGYNITETESIGDENVQTRDEVGTTEINEPETGNGNAGDSGTDTIDVNN